MTVRAPAPTSRLKGLSPAAVQSVVATAQALEAGRVDEAGYRIIGAMALNPDHPEVLRLGAGIDSLRGDHAAAMKAMRRAIEQSPDDPLYYNTLGTIHAEAGEYDDAIAALTRCCELQPGFAIAWYNLGVLLTRCVRNDEAIVALRKAVALAPDHAEARALLADMLRVGNQADAAASEYRRLIAERPTAGMAWWGLADLKTTKFPEQDIERMRTAMRDARASDDDLIAMGFALAKALDDQGRYAESLQALETANAIARRRKRWDSAAFTANIDAINAAFTPPPAGTPNPVLGAGVVFIVGLPRSGSTLVEQILASHSQVEGTSELPELGRIATSIGRYRPDGVRFPVSVRDLRRKDWRAYGRQYIDDTRRYRVTGQLRFTDKLPNNFSLVGFAHLILPNATIINTRRHPLDSCLGAYKQLFGYGQNFTYDVQDLAEYYKQYHAMMQHWHRVLPGKVLDVHYEETVTDLEGQVRRILQHCGLPFEERCVRFHETDRAVRTASSEQVRQPIYRDALGKWRRYEKHLDIWKEELAPIIAELPEVVRNAGL